MPDTLNKRVKLIIAVSFICGVLFASVGYAAIEYIQRIQNVGTIRVIGVEIYANEELTEPLGEIAWGMVSVGEQKTLQAWVKNTGNDAQKLVMWTESWEPTQAQNYITLTWNYTNSWIPVNASIPVTFTLSVFSNITGVTNFSFDIWIKGVH